MKLPKVSAVLAAAALAPTVLFPSMASAAEQPKPVGVSGPDTAADTTEDGGSQEAADRAEVRRILADKDAGISVHEAAAKVVDGTAAELRQFLEVGLPNARIIDDRVKAAQFLSVGGPAVKAAAEKALKSGSPEAVRKFLTEGQFVARAEDDDRAEVRRILADKDAGISVHEFAAKVVDGTAAELRQFLEVGLPRARSIDDLVKTAQILSAGGPAVQAAANKAMSSNSPEAVRKFLAEGQHTARAEDDRAEVQRILADKDAGISVHEAAAKVVNGTAAELRQFMEVGLPNARAVDDRVKAFQVLAVGGRAVKAAAEAALRTGSPEAVRKFLTEGQHTARAEDDRVEILILIADKEVGPRVFAGAQKALGGTPADLRRFLEVDLAGLRESDNRVKVSQALETGGPAVKKAAGAALEGSYADVLAFLKEGWSKARAEDEANAAAARPTSPVQGQNAGQTVQTASGAGTVANPAPAVVPAVALAKVTGTTATTGTAAETSGPLAATGVDESVRWEAGGAAAAVAAGAALVAVSRRRRAAE
ncbi:ALF repeat-containing protein [Kitasatospora sp. NPDC058406]|uniref:ALF repeat-containing protein n=1 Tax=Streptomycetaceae TaxID=2062 RepID=UPI002E77C940|nr:ALF repeat-containing protein [Streptomyces sp. BE303]MED7949245.1 ALF repeat-containing protein [Streptomyces sp. BE303]